MESSKLLQQMADILDSILSICQDQKRVALSTETVLALDEIARLSKSARTDGSGLRLVEAVPNLSPEQSLHRAIEKIEAIPEMQFSPEQRARLSLQFGRAHYLVGDLLGAQERFEAALRLSEEPAFADVKADAHKRIGDVAFRQNRFAQAEKSYEDSLKVYEQINDLKGQAHVLNDLGTVAFYQKDVMRVKELFSRCLQAAQQTEDARLLAKANNNLGICHNIQGFFAEALEYFRNALRQFQELNDHVGLSEVYNNLGLCYARQEKWSQAGDCYENAVQNAKKADHVYQMAVTYIQRAELCIQISNLKAAKSYCDQALDCFIKIGNQEGLAEGYKLLGVINRDLGHYDVSKTYLYKALEICTKIGNKLNEAETLVELGKLEQAREQEDDAESWFNRAISVFASIGAEEEVKKIAELKEASKEEELFAF